MNYLIKISFEQHVAPHDLARTIKQIFGELQYEPSTFLP